MNKQSLRRFRFTPSVVFSSSAAVVVLWKLLMPGYVLTLDLVFGPHSLPPHYSPLTGANFLGSCILYILQFMLGGWLLEKAILFAILFLLFYLPLRFYPFSNSYGEKYFVSVLFAMNPFVYERFLAGQWKVLLGYCFLFPFVSSLLFFYRNRSWRSGFWAYIWILGISMFSTHLLVIGGFLLLVYLVVFIPNFGSAKKLFLLGLLFLLLNTYWLVPLLVSGSPSRLAEFSPAHWEAFKTATDPHLGTLGNVAALYGFWGEHEYWATQFIFPKTHFGLWISLSAVLAALIVFGLIKGLRGSETRRPVIFLSLICLLALIFSTGIGEGVVRNLNLFLFQHIWFWRGFRDTQKWSAVIACAYALIGGLGAQAILAKIKRQSWCPAIIAGFCLVAAFNVYPMAFGFMGQLQPSWYPASWAEANDALKETKNCKVVFLPWQEYYGVAFNRHLLTANPSKFYFDCLVVSGQNLGIGEIQGGSSPDPDYARIENLVTAADGDPDQTISALKDLGITDIIYTNDVVGQDPYKYPFLGSRLATKIIDEEGLDMFSIR